MAKWSGKIGFVMPEIEVKPGVWKPESIVEKTYYGDMLTDYRRTSTSTETTNDELSLNNQISIVANSFAMENFYAIRYAKFMGVAWRVTSIDANQRPRLILTLGGVYNGPQAETA